MNKVVNKNFYMNKILYFIFLLFIYFNSTAQSITLDSLAKQKLFHVSGGVNMTLTNTINNNQKSINPFAFYASGNITFSVQSISVPLTFMYSNQKFSTAYTQPFNQFSVHPTYRGIQGHIGWHSTSFSQYSLNGHSFYGTGVDMKIPKSPLTISAMYGRLLKNIEGDTITAIVGNDTSYNAVLPVFKRKGYGAKLTLDKKGNNLALSFFNAFDDKNSLQNRPEQFGVFAEKNMVVTIAGSTTLQKNMKLSGEIGRSFINKDALQSKKIVFLPPSDLPIEVIEKTTSKFAYNAVKANLSYAVPKSFSTFGFGYERIDPGYRTLGAYFFNNDMQNITVNFGQQLLKGKLSINGSSGIQKDDLKRVKANRYNRILHNYTLNIVPTSKLNVSTSYSNFTTYSFIKDQFREINNVIAPNQNWDSLSRYAQIAQSANASVSYNISTAKTITHSISTNISFNDTKEIQGSRISSGQNVKIYTAILGYNIAFTETKTNISIAANYMRNNYATGSSEAIGGTLVFSKPIFPIALPLQFAASYNTTKQADAAAGGVLNMRLGTSYTLFKKHALSFSMIALLRKSAGDNGASNKTIFENVNQISYNYGF